MNVTINWGTKVISVAKTELTLIQETPIEIRQMDLDAFRMALKTQEDSEDGMAFPDTHRHATEATLGGVTYARMIEIINGYTVTFVDGQYSVNLVGANSNVGDVINANQVSVRSANAAGLIVKPADEAPTAQEIATAVDTELTGMHGAGAWTTPAGLATATELAIVSTKVAFIQKLLRNRLELQEGSNANWVLYDDDGTTPLSTWHVKDKNGNAITINPGAPARRAPTL